MSSDNSVVEQQVNEFLHYASRPLGPKAKQGVDIEDFGKKFKYISQDHDTPAEHYAMHPKVKHYAPARTTKQYDEEKDFWKRFNHPQPKDLVGDYTNCNATLLSEREALLEAARCLKCTDAPCVSACPSSVDVPAFIQAIELQNYALAAKIILSANSNGLSCGNICATSDLCSGSCTLATPHSKGINIEGLQKFALDKFAQMQINPTIDQNTLANATQDEIALRSTPIAVIGAGPAGLSVATFLARMGYNNITIFEKEKAAGGINTFELPEFRLPHIDVQYEIQLLEALGVKFVYGKSFVASVTNDEKEISYTSLQAAGYKNIFLGFGRPNPIILPEFKGLTPENGIYNSKEFLPLTTIASKPALTALYDADNLPKLDFTGKRVIVLGGGDVAVDAATTSIRLGSTNVSIVFRKNTADMRCMIEERHHAESEHIDFIPYCLPKQVILDETTQKVKIMEFYKQSKDMSGNYVTDPDEFIRLKADIVITAFGCKAAKCDELIPGLKTRRDGCVDIDAYGRTNINGIFAGGDLTGASTTVGASNDGKIAAWAMHLAILGQDKDEEKLKNIQLPDFHTPIDDIDVSIVVDGVKYPNPFVLASAPPCTSYEMIDRAFEIGWGGAVVKTFVLDKDMVTNVTGRITTSTQGTEDVANSKKSWFNIELITEKTAEYWYDAMAKLKKRHPNNVVISSIMCTFNQADWTEMATKSIMIGNCDALELNLSCPHMGTKGNQIAKNSKKSFNKLIINRLINQYFTYNLFHDNFKLENKYSFSLFLNPRDVSIGLRLIFHIHYYLS